MQPICLPFDDKADENYVRVADGKREALHVAGWGATNEQGEIGTEKPVDRDDFANLKKSTKEINLSTF